MFPEVEGALGILPCSRATTVDRSSPVTGHASSEKRPDRLFASLMAMALGSLESSAVSVSDASAAPDEGVQALLSVSGPPASNPSLPAGSLGVSGETDGGLPWTARDTGGIAGESSEPLPVGPFFTQRTSIPDKTGLFRPDKPSLGTEQASSRPDTLRLWAEPNGVDGASRFPAIHTDLGLDREEAVSLPIAQVAGEHLTPTEAAQDGSLPLAKRLLLGLESQAGPVVTLGSNSEEAARTAEEAPRRVDAQVAAGSEGAVRSESSAPPRTESPEGAAPQDLESGAGFPTGRTVGEPEKGEPVEAGKIGFMRHPAPAEGIGSPEALITSGSGEKAVPRKVVSLRDARALAEHLREEALKKLPRSVELRLDPPRLGSLTAILTARGQDIAVKFVTGSHEAFRALQTSAGELAKSFNELGLTLAGFSVDQGRPQGRSSGEERGSAVHLGMRRTTRASAPETAPVETTAAHHLLALSGRQLDYVV